MAQRVFEPAEEAGVLCAYFKQLGLPYLGAPRLRALLGGRDLPGGLGAPGPLGATAEEAERLMERHLSASGLPPLRTVLWRGPRA